MGRNVELVKGKRPSDMTGCIRLYAITPGFLTKLFANDGRQFLRFLTQMPIAQHLQ